MLITGPLHPCPRCGRVQLGTLSISDFVHTRRCRNCFHDEEERLPRLAKKMIYLDQMMLSGIAKELDPVWRKKTQRSDGFWRKTFDQIDRLVKLQLIVCPESPIHEVESSYDDRYDFVLRRLYKHLARGVSLHFPHEVLMVQLSEAFEAWFANREPDWNRITRDDVIYGRLDGWNDRLLLTVKMGYLAGEIEGRRESRNRGHENLKQLWRQWASEGQMPFDDLHERERRGFADAAFQSWMDHLQRLHGVVTGVEEVADPLQLMPGWPVQLISWVLSRLEEKGVPSEEQLQQAQSFLYSEPALSAPENHLGALLFAALARRSASGQKRVPNRGTPNDIRFISAYLPYCDAMFVDNEFAQLLSEEPLATAVKAYPARIFSTRSRNDFLTYLVGLEEKTDPAHVALVTRTYGETWTEPYRSMLEHERSKRVIGRQG